MTDITPFYLVSKTVLQGGRTNEFESWGNSGSMAWNIQSYSQSTIDEYANQLGLKFKLGKLGDCAGVDCCGDPPNIYLVATNIPYFAKPCTKYKRITNKLGANWAFTVFEPQCDDPNYMALGHVARHQTTWSIAQESDYIYPSVGEYYLVHKRFIHQISTGNPPFNGGWNGAPLYRPFGNSINLFKSNDSTMYSIRPMAALQDCCTGSGKYCDSYITGSLGCQEAITTVCDSESIKPGGSCYDWCSRDQADCDVIKNRFCITHPTDPWCDCINATQRQDYKDIIKGKELIYATSRPVCYYPRCQTENNVFRTASMNNYVDSGKCSTDISYIDQSIKVSGGGNTLNTSQTNKTDGTSGGSSGGSSGGTEVDGKPSTSTTSNTTSDTTTTSTTTADSSEQKKYGPFTLTTWLFIGIIVFIFLLILIFRGKKKKKRSKDDD